mgnify:CR=1 FL=1
MVIMFLGILVMAILMEYNAYLKDRAPKPDINDKMICGVFCLLIGVYNYLMMNELWATQQLY